MWSDGNTPREFRPSGEVERSREFQSPKRKEERPREFKSPEKAEGPGEAKLPGKQTERPREFKSSERRGEKSQEANPIEERGELEVPRDHRGRGIEKP
jgi:hypothetical protein